MSRDQLLDWLAVYDLDPWGEQRQDIRAAVASIWTRGAKFDELRISYPHAPDMAEISEEDEIEAIEQIAAEQEREKHAPA